MKQNIGRNIVFISLLLIILFSCISLSSADTVLVDIDFDLNNIATMDHQLTNPSAIIPYTEITDVISDVDRETLLGRTIIIDWHMINYVPTEDLYSEEVGGYHLFDFTWYRKGVYSKYKEKNGQWTELAAFPTGYNLNPNSYATINGYGDYPILISPTICPGGICIGGGGELYGKFNETIDREIKKEQYSIRVTNYPVTKAVYLILNDSNLIGKKLELYGDFILGDSAIVTINNPRFYPLDEYSLNLMYTSYFPSKVTFNMKDIEDLSLSSSNEIKYTANENEYVQTNLTLSRAYKELIVLILPIIGILFGLHQNPQELGKFRLYRYVFTYVSPYIAVFVSVPKPSNIPPFNLLYFVLGLLAVLILGSEIYLYRKNRPKRKEPKGGSKKK